MKGEYGGLPLGEFFKWWGNCDDCGAGITVQAGETETLPDSEDWDSGGFIRCPVCGGRADLGNGDPR